jgi:membrane fusion protein, heavy metal efflux system
MRSGKTPPKSRPRGIWLSILVGVLACGPLACGRTHNSHDHALDESRESEITPTPVHAEESGQVDKHDHEHDEHGPGGDLDRPVEELFDSECEHEIKAFTCTECRYEVGVVRAPEDLVREGLFEMVQPTTRVVAAPVELTGEIRFDERLVAHVSPPTEGVIRRVHVMVGDEVKRGQSLMELESVRAGDAHGELLEARARLELAKRSFERAAALKRGGIASEKEYLEAKMELDSAKIRTDAASGRLQRLGGTGGAGTIVLRAPVDGSILLLHAVPGEFASSNESLATVGNNKAVWVWADLYERDIARVMTARSFDKLAASVFVKAYPGEAFPGTVDFLSPAMDRSSRTVKTRIQVDNSDGRLLAGMFAAVQVFLPGDDRTLALPSDAVLDDNGRSFVFLHHHEDYYVRREVEVGRSWARWVEIKGGVNADQHVVSRGAFLMKSDVLRSKMGAGCAD